MESGEPLVDFLEVSPELLIDRPRFSYRRETLARKSLAEKLGCAARLLPAGYKLAVIECWRAPNDSAADATRQFGTVFRSGIRSGPRLI